MKSGKQRGQILIVLLLIVLVGLTIALAASQRSTLSLNNSDKNDQSSRAFDAAEAGIEQAISQNLLSGSLTIPPSTLNNQSSVTVTAQQYPVSGGSQILQYLEPVGKDTTALFWLDSPQCDYLSQQVTVCPGGPVFSGSQFQIYFGNKGITIPSNDDPAIEVNLVDWCTSVTCMTTPPGFVNHRIVFDSNGTTRAGNNFKNIQGNCGGWNEPTTYSATTDQYFQCVTGGISIPANEIPILVRTRFLYSNEAQVLALDPMGSTLPSQATVYTATGTSGQTIHKLQRFVMPGVVSPLLDFSIFSANDLSI